MATQYATSDKEDLGTLVLTNPGAVVRCLHCHFSLSSHSFCLLNVACMLFHAFCAVLKCSARLPLACTQESPCGYWLPAALIDMPMLGSHSPALSMIIKSGVYRSFSSFCLQATLSLNPDVNFFAIAGSIFANPAPTTLASGLTRLIDVLTTIATGEVSRHGVVS